MDKKWLVVGMGLLCLLLSSRTPHWFRGLVMPISAFVLFFTAGLMWISDRMGTVARDQVYVPSPEELAAIERAKQERLRGAKSVPDMSPTAVPAADLQAKLAAIRQAEVTGEVASQPAPSFSPPQSPPPLIKPTQPLVKPNVADLQAKLAALRAAEQKARDNPNSPT